MDMNGKHPGNELSIRSSTTITVEARGVTRIFVGGKRKGEASSEKCLGVFEKMSFNCFRGKILGMIVIPNNEFLLNFQHRVVIGCLLKTICEF